MGKQLIIVGLSGSFDPELAAGLVALMQKYGSVRHVSHFYDGSGHLKFATGTLVDLQGDLQDLSRALSEVPLVDLRQASVGTGKDGVEARQDPFAEVLTLLRRIDGNTTPPVAAPKKKKGAAGAEEKTAPPEAPKGPPAAADGKPLVPGDVPALGREVVGGICTRCGEMCEGEEEADDHLSGPMCEPKGGGNAHEVTGGSGVEGKAEDGGRDEA